MKKILVIFAILLIPTGAFAKSDYTLEVKDDKAVLTFSFDANLLPEIIESLNYNNPPQTVCEPVAGATDGTQVCTMTDPESWALTQIKGSVLNKVNEVRKKKKIEEALKNTEQFVF